MTRIVVVPHGSAPPETAARLSPGDRDRLAALHGERAAAFLAGRAALLAAIGPRDAGAAVDATCPDCGRSHGRPRLPTRPSLHLSLSHAAGLAFAVAASAPIGIDAEPLGTDPARLAGAAALLPGRGDALRRWTAVEAVLKAEGRGLRVDPVEVRLRGRTATLQGVRYRLTSSELRGCRVTVAQAAAAVSDGSRVSRSHASKKPSSGDAL